MENHWWEDIVAIVVAIIVAIILIFVVTPLIAGSGEPPKADIYYQSMDEIYEGVDAW